MEVDEIIKKQDFSEIISKMRNILSTDKKYETYKRYEEELTSIENSISELEKDEVGGTGITASDIVYEVTLQKVNDLSIIKKLKLPAEKTYLYMEKADGKLNEGTPRNLKEGYYVVILDNDERKTILELIIEMLDLEDSVDKNLIEPWKIKLAAYIEKNDLSYSRFYQLYIDNGGRRNYQTVVQWAKGNVIGPEDVADIKIIGEIIDDEDIISDYELIDREVKQLRKIHRNIGRQLRAIIKMIIDGQIDTEKLSYEQLLLFEKIKDGIYMIDKVMKCDNNNI